jgi:hypothetical protein
MYICNIITYKVIIVISQIDLVLSIIYLFWNMGFNTIAFEIAKKNTWNYFIKM